MINRLKGTMCYLCGAMDRVPDGGEGWRRMISPVLRDMGIGVLDPCNKPTDFAEENAEFRKEVEILKLSKRYDQVKKLMRDVAAIDLRMVDIAHFVIMYMDTNVHMCGSYHEASVAIQQKKPLLIVCKQGKQHIPNWMYGVMPHEHMFSDWLQLIDYLSEVHLGRNPKHYKRWRFFDFERVYGK